MPLTMSTPRYVWRQLTSEQRKEVLAWRKNSARPWHSPPHRPNYGHLHFLVSAACFEHASHIGYSPQRMDRFSSALLGLFEQHAARTVAWCVLPNHYHALVDTPNILRLLYELGRCTDVRAMLGTVRKTRADDKSSIAPLSGLCVPSATSSRPLTMFITTPHIIATCGCGPSGDGAAHLNILTRWAAKKLNGFGGSIPFAITARNGMMLPSKLGVMA